MATNDFRLTETDWRYVDHEGRLRVKPVEAMANDDGVVVAYAGGAHHGVCRSYRDADVFLPAIVGHEDYARNEATGDWEFSLGVPLAKHERDTGRTISPEKVQVIAGNLRRALTAWPRSGPNPFAFARVRFSLHGWDGSKRMGTKL